MGYRSTEWQGQDVFHPPLLRGRGCGMAGVSYVYFPFCDVEGLLLYRGAQADQGIRRIRAFLGFFARLLSPFVSHARIFLKRKLQGVTKVTSFLRPRV